MNGAIPPYVTAGQQPAAGERDFGMRFTSTPRGARLARRLVSHRLDDWGHPYDSTANEVVTLIAAELAANAVRHGHVPGRDFHLRLTEEGGDRLRVEVTDTRGERMPDPVVPVAGGVADTPADAESGRGLLLVAALSDAWGTRPRAGAPGKTVWAQYHAR
ncbi:ATP-binding protein [Streptomyces niger]|uniref:ATP-binding protein n=1 Tax=Streptomyces niger TaxID=66373 RepID=UPI002D21E936|nr:ATP-binding protein [Streptomyces niger]